MSSAATSPTHWDVMERKLSESFAALANYEKTWELQNFNNQKDWLLILVLWLLISDSWTEIFITALEYEQKA